MLVHHPSQVDQRKDLSNCVWKFSGKYGMAYLENRKLVDEILMVEGRPLHGRDVVLATYYSPGGKTFAWQVRFSMANWAAVSRALGLDVQ